MVTDKEAHQKDVQNNAIKEIIDLRNRYRGRMEEIIFYSGNPDKPGVDALIDTSLGRNEINKIITSANLPEWDWKCDIRQYPDDYDWNDYTVKDSSDKIYPAGMTFKGDKDLLERKFDLVFDIVCSLVKEWNSSLDRYIASVRREIA